MTVEITELSRVATIDLQATESIAVMRELGEYDLGRSTELGKKAMKHLDIMTSPDSQMLHYDMDSLDAFGTYPIIYLYRIIEKMS